MIPVIFHSGLNYVIDQKGKEIPHFTPLYYWHNSDSKYKHIGSLYEIRNNLGASDIEVRGMLDGVNTILGDIHNVVLYYNSKPDLPIEHIGPDVRLSPPPVPSGYEELDLDRYYNIGTADDKQKYLKYKQKYLKYKQKYLNLKNKIN